MNYHPDLIDFFKRHNMYDPVVFKYLETNTMMIDYRDEEQRPSIGCYYQLVDGYLKNIQICIPHVYDEITMLISIHEITHGIENYYKLGQKFKKGIDIEALPILYERLYILERNSEELNKYGDYLDSFIDEKCSEEYNFAIRIREELLKHYHYDMHKMAKLTKKLAKKHAAKTLI